MLIAALALLAAFWAARIVNASELDHRFDRMEAWLRRFGPVAVGIVSLAIVWWVWGALSPIPVVHDESAYVLQAEIFARFRWTAPGPVIPEFFEQPYVLVVPAVAAKYPPGHSLLLAIGALVRFLPLVPLLVTAVTAALLFIVVIRVTNAWIALLSWIIWLTTPLVLRFQAGYFSETTTTALVLASWLCLLEWRRTRQRSWLLLLALAVGWGAITRPLTMFAFAIPIAVVVVIDIFRNRLWLDVALGLVVGVAVLAIIPLWSARTTRDRRVTPLEQYTRDYVPFDKPGFTLDTTPPRRALSPVQKSLYDDYRAHHERQQLRHLPRTFVERVFMVGRDLWRGTQLMLLPFAIAGLFFMTRELRLAAQSAGLLFLFHLPYAYDAAWTLYYLELVPVIAALTAVGLWRALVKFAPGVGTLDAERRPMLGTALVVLVLAMFAFPTVDHWRGQHQQMSSLHTAFAAAMQELPSSKSVVFLRYSLRPHHVALVFNFAHPSRASTWVVHDLGPRNRELLQKAQDRTAYLFEEETGELRAYRP